MMQQRKYISLIVLIILINACKERFEPNLPLSPQGYLVVEGFINAQGPTQIKLSRSTPIDQKKVSKAELNANIKIEGDDNSSFQLSGASNGLYHSVALPINPSRKYRLRIKTKDNREYLSDFVAVKITPPIDSVSWKEEKDRGVQIYVNTHDPQNKTVYYRYDYDATWEIRSAYYANYKYDNGVIRPTDLNDPQIYYCWKYDTSSTIILGSSAKLESDVIHLNPVLFIPATDEKLGVRYSIQVRQYAMDKEGYQFMEQIKKNTESLGSIFDPQPSAVNGNIHSVSDPAEIVIGYINATTVQEKRIYISEAQLANRGFSIHDACETVRVANHPDSLAKYLPGHWPYEAVFMGIAIVAYDISTISCVDCRERKGKNIKPGFW